jgi:hypothetical protein
MGKNTGQRLCAFVLPGLVVSILSARRIGFISELETVYLYRRSHRRDYRNRLGVGGSAQETSIKELKLSVPEHVTLLNV